MLKYSKKIKRAMLVTAALQVAEEEGLINVSHVTVAARCMVPTSEHTCRSYFTKDELFDGVLADPRCSEKIKRQARDIGIL